MKSLTLNRMRTTTWLALLFSLASCVSHVNKKDMDQSKNGYVKGTYGYDADFFSESKINTVELKDSASNACIMLIPAYQGRVMTSSADGNEGFSYGWINYDLIKSGKISAQFNPVGGEERFWIGPEGGPFSIYFPEGAEQEFKNWVVPPVIDTEIFEVKEQSEQEVTFTKKAVLKNASGSIFNIGIQRKVSILPKQALKSKLNVEVPLDDLNVVAYQSENILTNTGENQWTKDNGLLSIWLLCMFNPSPTTTVFIPYNVDADGKIVNDEYFGKVPADRLKAEDGTVFFKIDGKYRSKIGLPPGRAKNLCGSFDSEKNVLTLLWCSLPTEPAEYVNSNWGEQDNPYEGDVVNSYNDGPVEDGSIMGPFYEIETSSPAALLSPGESITHVQRVVHIQGEKAKLAKIVSQLFDLEISTIESKFN